MCVCLKVYVSVVLGGGCLKVYVSVVLGGVSEGVCICSAGCVSEGVCMCSPGVYV